MRAKDKMRLAEDTMLCETGAAAPGCTCLMPQHCSGGLGSALPSKPPWDAWHGNQPWLCNCFVLLTKEENLMEGCKAVWAISRGLRVLGGHAMPLTPEGQRRMTLKTARTDTHPITPQPGVLQSQTCRLHTKEIQK